MSALIRPHDLGTVLSVWAHPDDETYLAAGVMGAAADGGSRRRPIHDDDRNHRSCVRNDSPKWLVRGTIRCRRGVAGRAQ